MKSGSQTKLPQHWIRGAKVRIQDLGQEADTLGGRGGWPRRFPPRYRGEQFLNDLMAGAIPLFQALHLVLQTQFQLLQAHFLKFFVFG